MRLIFVLAALMATPFARLASQADSSITRVAWNWAELLTFADTTDGVRLWLAPRPHAPHRDDVRPTELSDAFVPDSVNAWDAATRAARAAGMSHAQRNEATIVRFGTLRGRDGTRIVIEIAPGADSDHDAWDAVVTPARGAPLRFDLEPDQVDGFLCALAKAASASRMSQETSATGSIHVTPASLDSHAHTSQPHYPDDLKDERIEGEVWAQFDIDSSGVADMSTFRVLFADHQEFELAVRKYIGTARFVPEMRNGVRTRARAEQLFRFLFDD